MKKLLSLCVVCIFTITMFAGCKNNSESNNIVNISILSSKPEIESALNKAINEFTKENSDINVKIVKYSQSGSYKDKLSSMYEGENPPTISLVDPSNINDFEDYLADLSLEDWVKDISGEISDIAKDKNGNIIAFPFATEGIGFIYNKKVLDAAGVDASNINTIEALEEAFNKVEASGKKAVVVTNEEWSLGDHFLATFYSSDIGKSAANVQDYFKNLKSSDLNNNEVLNGLIDTFDIMKRYNIYSDSPLTPSYDKCAELLGKGEVAFWYMGNWAAQEVISSSSGNEEFGFISVPISNNSSDYGNGKIAVGVTKYFIIDGKYSSNEQQEAAKKFLNYLVYNEKGNKFMVEDAGIIPSFDNINIMSEDPLVNEIINYRDNNNTMELMNSYLPSDNSKIIGGALRKYLNNEINREDLIRIISNFWGER